MHYAYRFIKTSFLGEECIKTSTQELITKNLLSWLENIIYIKERAISNPER